MTYKELVELKEKMSTGEITQDAARELFWADYKEGKRSWHTKDWKERRGKILKDACQICGSTESLTLQHRSHPKKYYDYQKEAAKKYASLSTDSDSAVDECEFSVYVSEHYDYQPVPLCPNCNGRYPNKRITKTPQYLCTECRMEFDEPLHKTVDELISMFYSDKDIASVRDKCFVSKNKWRNEHNLSQAKYWLLRERSQAEFSNEIENEGFSLYLNDTIKYLSFEDTMTACKKCAFNFDINCMDLCPKCKTYYKGVGYQTCIQCLPEDIRKAALEKIEFGKEMQAMHEALGID